MNEKAAVEIAVCGFCLPCVCGKLDFKQGLSEALLFSSIRCLITVYYFAEHIMTIFCSYKF